MIRAVGAMVPYTIVRTLIWGTVSTYEKFRIISFRRADPWFDPLMSEIAIWSKSHPSYGSRIRVIRNLYAWRVSAVMAGREDICPCCERDLIRGDMEVDRATPELDYRPGNVVYVCGACNQGRAALQSVSADWQHVASYVSDVARASESVSVPTEREAREWWNARPERVCRSKYQ